MIVLHLINHHFSFVCRKNYVFKKWQIFRERKVLQNWNIKEKGKKKNSIWIRMIVDWTQCDKPRYQPPVRIIYSSRKRSVGEGHYSAQILSRSDREPRVHSRVNDNGKHPYSVAVWQLSRICTHIWLICKYLVVSLLLHGYFRI